MLIGYFVNNFRLLRECKLQSFGVVVYVVGVHMQVISNDSPFANFRFSAFNRSHTKIL